LSAWRRAGVRGQPANQDLPPGIVQALKEKKMDKDRVVGSAKVVKGKVKEAIGKAVGDAKLEAEGTADKIEGKVQNAVGGIKDAIKGK
jgi:uncharacterized protein YjbJ (UPF0337 family)